MMLPEMLDRYGILRHERHKQLCEQSDTASYLINQVLRKCSVNIAVGDSGLGKSPFFYQMGLCLAAGVPMLGMQTKQCRVLYADLENPPDVSLQLKEEISRHLGLQAVPDDFLVCGFDGQSEHLDNDDFYKSVRPSLVIIDSLRAWKPSAEMHSEDAAKLLNRLRVIAREHESSFLLVHHTKKPGGMPVSLRSTRIMTWLLEACGARALINQTDLRMAFEQNDDGADAALLWKFFLKARGESGLFYTARSRDECGEPIGYKPVIGAALLDNEEQRQAFGKLPPEFSFTEAQKIYGKSADPTHKFLKKCQSLGLIHQAGRRAKYRKVEMADTIE